MSDQSNPISEDKELSVDILIKSIIGKNELTDVQCIKLVEWHNHKLAEFKKQIVSSCAKEFDELCKKVHTDPGLGNSSKGKKDNFLDGAEVMLTHIQLINQLKEKSK